MNRQPPARDKQTREMIRRFETRRKRRRRLRFLLAGLGAAIVVALIATAVVLATKHNDPWSPDDLSVASSPSDTTSSQTGTSQGSSSTTGRPVTTATVADPGTDAASSTDASTTPTATSSTVAVESSTPTPASSTPTPAPPASAGLVVVIDPGHQARADPTLEPVGPGSSEQKARVSSGTAGVVTGTPESELVLTVSLKLRDSLAAHGIKVVMTRTTQDVSISNIERAQIANDVGADLFVRVHADGNSDPAVHGIHVLYPASIPGWTDDIASTSKQAAALVQQELIAATGAKDRGINPRDDITGFNWSDVPVILPEIGFMTNPEEDKLLATAAYQDKIVQALTRAILTYLRVS